MASENKNLAFWLSSFDKPARLIDLPIPSATSGSAVVQILATFVPPYTHHIHAGRLPGLGLVPPLVPNPAAVARIYSTGRDAVQLKAGQLVYVDPTVHARDAPGVVIMQGHHRGNANEGSDKLFSVWRDGSLQQFQNVPLENCYPLDEERLLGDLGYKFSDLAVLPLYIVAAGAVIEAAELKAGETIVIGPSGGSFGGAAVELALALGANVIALGREETKLAKMKAELGNPRNFSFVVMTGNVDKDTAAIIEATPGKAGAEVFNDWTPGNTRPPYLEAGVRSLKAEGRAILSGGAKGAAEIPYTLTVHRNVTVRGQWMCKAPTLSLFINMLTQGVVKIGRPCGAIVTTYSLEDTHTAIDHVAEHGRWRNYTVVCPNGLQ
ncbi:GroES-like protein [Thozetella sp. PMI_491]|nr:GroES-like protein [Thozetella sp. PMI_491]